jgi:RNA polymerase sigma-70 factor (ECF subfamily)
MRISDLATEESSEEHQESTATILLRARGGDSDARETLAGRYLTVLGRWAHGRLPRAARDLVDTDDIVQSAIVKALRRLDSFEARGEGAFLAYLRQILLNQIRDEARRAKRRPQHQELKDDLYASLRSPLEEVIGKESLERYESALDRLPENQKQAVILRLDLGFRYREIAEAIGSPTPSAARFLVARGLAHLSRIMRENDEGK